MNHRFNIIQSVLILNLTFFAIKWSLHQFHIFRFSLHLLPLTATSVSIFPLFQQLICDVLWEKMLHCYICSGFASLGKRQQYQMERSEESIVNYCYTFKLSYSLGLTLPEFGCDYKIKVCNLSISHCLWTINFFLPTIRYSTSCMCCTFVLNVKICMCSCRI